MFWHSPLPYKPGNPKRQCQKVCRQKTQSYYSEMKWKTVVDDELGDDNTIAKVNNRICLNSERVSSRKGVIGKQSQVLCQS